MELRTLRYFLAVCEHGTMSRAAEALHVTQPALSRQIAALERELGTPLLERHSRSVHAHRTGASTCNGAHGRSSASRTRPPRTSHAARTSWRATSSSAPASPRACAWSPATCAPFARGTPACAFTCTAATRRTSSSAWSTASTTSPCSWSYPDVDRYAHLRLSPTDAWGVLMRDDDPLVARETVGPADLLDAPLVVPERHAKGDKLTGLLATWFGERAAEATIAATYNLAYNGALLVREGVGRMLSFDGLTTVGPGTGLEFRLLFPPLVSVIDLAWKRDVPLGDAAQRFLALIRGKQV